MRESESVEKPSPLAKKYSSLLFFWEKKTKNRFINREFTYVPIVPSVEFAELAALVASTCSSIGIAAPKELAMAPRASKDDLSCMVFGEFGPKRRF